MTKFTSEYAENTFISYMSKVAKVFLNPMKISKTGDARFEHQEVKSGYVTYLWSGCMQVIAPQRLEVRFSTPFPDKQYSLVVSVESPMFLESVQVLERYPTHFVVGITNFGDPSEAENIQESTMHWQARQVIHGSPVGSHDYGYNNYQPPQLPEDDASSESSLSTDSSSSASSLSSSSESSESSLSSSSSSLSSASSSSSSNSSGDEGGIFTWGRGTSIYPSRLSSVVVKSIDAYSSAVAAMVLEDGSMWTITSFENDPIVWSRVGLDNDWKKVSLGNSHFVALKTDGTLWVWGNNQLGQLGNGTFLNELLPVQLGIANNWIDVAAGHQHSLALNQDGILYAWGDNTSGQLGLSHRNAVTSPTISGAGDADWMKIEAGGYSSMAIKSNGSLWTWGNNEHGQLGRSAENVWYSAWPGQVGTETDWNKISFGTVHAMAIKVDGSLWAWGKNSSGELGDGSLVRQDSPVMIGSDTDWVSTALAFNYSMALKSNGSVWTCGRNEYGHLGTGEGEDSAQFVLAMSGKNVQLIASGQYVSIVYAEPIDG